MKISSQEEYGLRIVLVLARNSQPGGLTINEIAEIENLPLPNVAKLLRLLRLKGIVTSQRGKSGGYILSKPKELIRVQDVLEALGGRLFEEQFCFDHSGSGKNQDRPNLCTHTIDCSIRSLWKMIQSSLDNTLESVTIADLMGPEKIVLNQLEFDRG